MTKEELLNALKHPRSEKPVRLEDLKYGTQIKHVKTGKVYAFSFVCKHTETEEELAVYWRFDENDDLLHWARPLSMFLDGRFVLL